MSKYLKMLRGEAVPKVTEGRSYFETQPRPPLTKLTEGAFGSFVSDPPGAFEKTHVCDGALVSADGGLYLPWGPYVNQAKLKEWQRELFEAVDQLAKLERWSREHYDTVTEAIDRQPISTLRPDLAHFRERLDKARAAASTGRQR